MLCDLCQLLNDIQEDSSRSELASRDLHIYKLDHVKYNMNLFCIVFVDRSFDIGM